MHVLGQEVCGIFVPYSQFNCKPKTLKNKVFFLRSLSLKPMRSTRRRSKERKKSKIRLFIPLTCFLLVTVVYLCLYTRGHSSCEGILYIQHPCSGSEPLPVIAPSYLQLEWLLAVARLTHYIIP